jgi:hypothetical protein
MQQVRIDASEEVNDSLFSREDDETRNTRILPCKALAQMVAAPPGAISAQQMFGQVT